MADAAAVPLWFVAREAARQVKVVLSGEGSDELFGGYAIYHQPGVVRAGERLPDWGRAPLKAAAALHPGRSQGQGPAGAHLDPAAAALHRQRPRIHRRPDRPDRPGRHRRALRRHRPCLRPGRATPGLDDVSTMQLVDINTWLAGDILVKADRMTMAHSLELRVPFLDSEVMAVASRLAQEEKIGSGTTKAGAARGDERGPAARGRRARQARLPRSRSATGSRGRPTVSPRHCCGMRRRTSGSTGRRRSGCWPSSGPVMPRRHLAPSVGAHRVLALAPHLRGEGLRPGRARLGAAAGARQVSRPCRAGPGPAR